MPFFATWFGKRLSGGARFAGSHIKGLPGIASNALKSHRFSNWKMRTPPSDIWRHR